MLPNEVALTKQGPLARIWLAAHWERKLSKAQFLQTDIPASVETIVGEDEEDATIALRLSGPLLLGIARIYSRKAKYLEDDCQDALLRIQVAFRNTNTIVDLTADQLNLSRTAITLPNTLSIADLMMQEPIYTSPETKASGRNRHSARNSDITLPDMQWSSMDLEIPYESNSLLPEPLADLDTNTQFDLGLDLDNSSSHPPTKRQREWRPRTSAGRRSSANDPTRTHSHLQDSDLSRADTSFGADESFASVGVGRDASIPPTSAADHVRSLVGDLDTSMDFSMDPIDVTMHASTPPRHTTEDRTSLPPLRDVSFEDAIGFRVPSQLSPSTVERLRSVAKAQENAASKPPPRKRLLKEDVTQMRNSSSVQMCSAAATMTTSAHELQCMPSSRTHLAIASLPKTSAHDTQFTLSTIWGAAMDPLQDSVLSKFHHDTRIRSTDALTEKQHWLREVHEQALRLNKDEQEFPHEVGRRASDAPWLTEDTRFADLSTSTLRSNGGDTTVDKSLPPADFSMNELSELPQIAPLDAASTQLPTTEAMQVEAPTTVEQNAPVERRRSSRNQKLTDASSSGKLREVRLSTPEAEDGDSSAWQPRPVSATEPLAVFETRVREASKSDSQQHWDASTLQAMHVLKSTMHDQHSTFQTLAHNASRRAAAGFFFELLVLGTKNCVKLEQSEAYGDIDIVAPTPLELP
ncbi:sister chromatid cohesion protein 1 [Malassezia psittaci]|uniref:Sister chromatid cohesion protein 1 n=1 Tax=Malassezia psittaci TaxID=1821823 RepID=A0AAF0FCJ7_9BASI|nr:sister chromatid cohesion protein 1 [Malassezia psittaci]